MVQLDSSFEVFHPYVNLNGLVYDRIPNIRPRVAEYPKLRENGQKPQKFRQNWLKITWNQHDSKLHYLISRVFLSKPLQKSFSSFFPWNQIQEKFQKCNFTIFSVKTTSNMLDESISRILPWNQLQNNIFVRVWVF